MEVPEPEIELELPKIEIDDSNATEAFPTSSAVDQEKQATPLEPTSVDAEKNHKLSVDTEISFKYPQCNLSKFQTKNHLRPHVNSGGLYEDGVKDLPAFDENIQEVSIESKMEPQLKLIRGRPRLPRLSGPSQVAKTPISCSICGSHWRTLSALNIHMRVHNGEKPYKCYICGKGHNQKSQLKVNYNISKNMTQVFLPKYLDPL